MLVFCLGAYFFSQEKIEKSSVGYSIVYGVLLSLPLMGILFKVWPGSIALLSFGVILTTLLFGFALFRFFKASIHAHYWKNMLWRVGIIYALTSFCFSIPTVAWVRIMTRDNPELQEVWVNSLENPDCQPCKEELNEMMNFSKEVEQ